VRFPWFGAAFARVVSVLMRSPYYKHFALADLEWLVVPPLFSGQFAVLDATLEGVALPVHS
jgi:hemolysin-activating ACP:hemolysin acyltransferase